MSRIEYDDGKPIKGAKDRVKECVPKGRKAGYYLIYQDGTEDKIEIGYLRIGEMRHLDALFNKVHNSAK